MILNCSSQIKRCNSLVQLQTERFRIDFKIMKIIKSYKLGLLYSTIVPFVTVVNNDSLLQKELMKHHVRHREDVVVRILSVLTS